MANSDLGSIVAHLKLDVKEYTNNIQMAMNNTKHLGNTVEQAQKGFTVWKGAMANLVADGIRNVASSVKGLASDIITNAADIQAANEAFYATLGDNSDAMISKLKELGKQNNVIWTRMQEDATLYYNAFTQGGQSASEATENTTKALNVASDAAAYYNMSLEDANEHLKSFMNGNTEAGDAIGISTTQTEIASWAAKELGVSWDKCSESEKKMLRMNYVEAMYKKSKVTGQAAREGMSWANVTANLQEVWERFLSRVGAPVLEALIPIIQQITENFEQWYKSVDWDTFGDTLHSIFKFFIDNGTTIISVIGGIVAGFVTFKTIIAGKFIYELGQDLIMLWQAASAGGGVMSALNAVMLANPAALIAVAVAGLVGTFIYLWNTCEGFREFWINLWNLCKQAFNSFIEENQYKIDAWVEYITDTWESIKTVFSGALDILIGLVDGDMNLISRGIKKVWTGIKNWLKSIWNTINKLTKGKLDEMANNMRDLAKKAGDWFKEKLMGVLDLIPDSVKETGKNIVEGIWSGISSGWNWLKDKISGFCNSIRDTFNKDLDINSPSRVMRDEVGKWIPEGIRVGIEANTKPLMDTVSALTGSITTSINPDLSSALSIDPSRQFSGIITNNNSLGSKLDRIEAALDRAAIDYHKMEDAVYNGNAKVDSNVYMDGTIVGRKTASTVKALNDRTQERLDRLEGTIKYK